ncbi:MAG TPA: hypothetical protein VN903_35660, partial [Polyangia bacterium]|nr:hypothetical protein [Polyangia bacterium]
IGPPAAPAGPVVDPLPSTPPAATAPNEAEKPSAEADEPAAVDDDTVSPPPKVTMTKKDGARRRPIRRATNMKHATRSSTGETPAQAAPVKRKLINEL